MYDCKKTKLVYLTEAPALGCRGCENQSGFDEKKSSTFMDFGQVSTLNFATGMFLLYYIFQNSLLSTWLLL